MFFFTTRKCRCYFVFECLFVFVNWLRKEIEQFLRHGGSGIAEHLENEFIMSLA